MNNFQVNQPNLYLLDFDGVIIESVDIKTNAFYEIYKNLGEEIAQKAKNHHLEYQGVDRFTKFKDIHKLYLKRECSPLEADNLSSCFTEIVFNAILEVPFVEGVIKFLEEKKREKVPLYLLSATPEEELRSICKKRNIDKLFSGIFGSPHQKNMKGKEIIYQLGVAKSKVVFIGDSIHDYEAALDIGVSFIGRVAKSQKNPFPSNVRIISDFNQLTSAEINRI